MKVAPLNRDTITETERAEAATTQVKVCMHVLNHMRADVRAQRAAISLARAGFLVTVIDIEGKEQTPVDETSKAVYVRHLMVPQWFIATRFRRWAILRAAWLLILGVVQLLQARADVYHALDLPALPACYIAALLRRKPVIFEAYELPLSTLPSSAMSRGRRWLHRLMAPLLTYMLPRCAGVITVSPPIVDEFYHRYHCKDVALVRNIPVYQTVMQNNRLHTRLGLQPQTRIALYQGYLQANRSLDLLIRAATFLDPDIVIVMMGKSDDGIQEELEALIAREGVDERVKILPPVAYDELLDWTASADLGLIVYDPTYVRNVEVMLPNKLFEYMMAGLPVLSSALPSVQEITDRYQVGQSVSSLAPLTIATAINEMVAHPETLATMHLSALRIAREEFYWEKECRYLLDLYRRILRPSRPSRLSRFPRQGQSSYYGSRYQRNA